MSILRFEYQGEKYPELRRKLHTITEVSKITGIPNNALRNRLRNTDPITDKLLYPHNLPRKVHKVEFKGDHDVFNDGDLYTTGEYASAAGVDSSTMWGRIRGKTFVTPHDLRAPDPKYSKKGGKNCFYESNLETRLERYSQKYLSRKLV